VAGGLQPPAALPPAACPEKPVAPAVGGLIPAVTARRYDLFPIRRINGCLTVAMADPTNLRALDDVAFATSLRVLPGIAPLSAIRRAIDRHYDVAAAQLAFSPEIGRQDVEL